ncbi:RNA polymerase-associated protein RapA [Arsenophonus endosymbiont of Bemisia tabaci Q2]|nr:RNA polymerase-associated protein RapA [Arsenophonus endosymbiont of Bemisia tabaci Q2]
MDFKGNDLAKQVEFESFNRQLNTVNRHTGSKLVNAVQKEVHNILQLSKAMIEKEASMLIAEAKTEADKILSLEYSRLEALKSVNPNIRPDELSAIEYERQQLLLNIDQANWRLDSIRLVIVTHQ